MNRFVVITAVVLESFFLQTDLAMAATPMVSAGYYHTVVLNADGTVATWGTNGWGQLGDGTSRGRRASPVAVNGLTHITSVAAGGLHRVALRDNGTVWTWGDNTHGQLGDGHSGGTRASPAMVHGLTRVVAVSAGASHSVALKSDGTVWTWGDNSYGQVASASTGIAMRASPGYVPNLTSVVAVFAGSYHTMALRSDGTVVTLGRHVVGQTGIENSSEPVGSPVATHRYCGSDGMW
jgi:alpha-tubulin suppressor-like RCC1 family protein